MHVHTSNEVNKITGNSTLTWGFLLGIGMGNGRYFIPARPQLGFGWGFREVSRRKFYVWLWQLRNCRASAPHVNKIIPGDVRYALERRCIRYI